MLRGILLCMSLLCAVSVHFRTKACAVYSMCMMYHVVIHT